MNEKLTTYLLSDQNIQDLTDMLDCTIYISPESLQACKKVIKENLANYITRLANLPQTEKQFIHTVSFLNKKCYEEIISFIEKSCPGKNIFKQETEIIMSKQEFEQYLKTRINHDTVLKALTDPAVLLYLKTMIENLNEKADESDGEIIDIHQLQAMLNKRNPEPQNTYQPAQIDLSNMNTQTIMKIQSRIEQLAQMPQSDLVTEEKTKLITALVNYQKAQTTVSVAPEIVDGKYDIDVMITPKTEDDLKSITFQIGVDRKVVNVQLISYFIPKTEYNVTNLTNTFMVCYNGELIKHSIEPGKYTMDQLIGKIQTLMPFLTVSVSDKVTVSTGSKFEILVQDNSAWPLLGFESANYSRKTTYTAKDSYCMDLNESAYIGLDRSNIDPVLITLGEHITLDKPAILKQTSKPMPLKEITIKVVDKLSQYYDLIGKSFKVHIRVEFE